MVMRKLGGSAKPTLTIARDADKLSVKSETSVKTTEFKFKFGEEFPESTADGRNVQVCDFVVAFHFSQLRQFEKRAIHFTFHVNYVF